MDKQELILSKEFSTYRQAEFDEAGKMVGDLFKSSADPMYIKGALDMLRRIINIPVKFAGSKEAEEATRMMIEKDFNTFKTKFIRGFLDEG
ncbi:MAG: hypothetical protein KAX30_04235 [Candidatus Atribacteria bacterium]|nr:hypothetical protein [Candidatus Atribacteria bacterium]